MTMRTAESALPKKSVTTLPPRPNEASSASELASALVSSPLDSSATAIVEAIILLMFRFALASPFLILSIAFLIIFSFSFPSRGSNRAVTGAQNDMGSAGFVVEHLKGGDELPARVASATGCFNRRVYLKTASDIVNGPRRQVEKDRVSSLHHLERPFDQPALAVCKIERQIDRLSTQVEH